MTNRELRDLYKDLTEEEIASLVSDNSTNTRQRRRNLNLGQNPTRMSRNNPPNNPNEEDNTSEDRNPPPGAPDNSQPPANEQNGASATNLTTDPVLQGLSPTKIAYISSLIAQQISSAANTIRVVSVNPAINLPYYDEENMTSDTFFTQCELYLASQGTHPAQYHERISIVLKSDKKLWFDSIARNVKSWDQFKSAFKRKYDSETVQERRRNKLYHRQQQPYEPVEQYVMEMVNLAKQVFPSEDEKITVLRTKRGLVPELRMFIGDCTTVDELLEKAESAIENIKANDRKNQRHTRLPPFRAYRRGGFRQDNFRGGFNPRFHANRPPRQDSSYAHEAYRQPNRDSSFRSRLHSNPTVMGERPFTGKCNNCQAIGHIARFCPRNNGGFQSAPQVPSTYPTTQQPVAGPSGTQNYNRGRYTPTTTNTQDYKSPLNQQGR